MLKRYETLEAAPERSRTVFRSPLGHILPSAVTLLSLCCGMSAIELAIMGRYQSAVIVIILAGVLDGLDGRAARFLNTASTFGAELDSLADLVSFGVAPALVIYHWSLASFAGFGWAFAMFYAACCGMRLARFNTQLHEQTRSSSIHGWFVGVPAPAGAGLVLIPMFLAFASGAGAAASPTLNAAVVTLVALLMVSRVPTWSLKLFQVKHDRLVPALIAATAVAGLVALKPWWTLTAGGILYAASIPAGLFAYRRALVLEQQHSRRAPPAASPS